MRQLPTLEIHKPHPQMAIPAHGSKEAGEHNKHKPGQLLSGNPGDT